MDFKRAKTFHKNTRVKADKVTHSISIPRKLFDQLEALAKQKNISRNALVNLALLDFVMDKEYLATLATQMGKENLRQMLALNFHEKVNYIKGK